MELINREYLECLEVVYRLTPQIGNNMNRIQEMIREIPILSEIQKKFFTSIVNTGMKKYC